MSNLELLTVAVNARIIHNGLRFRVRTEANMVTFAKLELINTKLLNGYQLWPNPELKGIVVFEAGRAGIKVVTSASGDKFWEE